MGAGGGNGCAGNWFLGSGHGFGPSAAAAVAAQYNGTEPIPWELLPKTQVDRLRGQLLPEVCVGLLEPNNLIYDDDGGVRRSKHIPKGKYRQSMKYLNEHNWTELAKLPVWGK